MSRSLVVTFFGVLIAVVIYVFPFFPGLRNRIFLARRPTTLMVLTRFLVCFRVMEMLLLTKKLHYYRIVQSVNKRLG